MARSDNRWYFSFLPYNLASGSTSPLIPLFITEVLRGSLSQVGLASAISSAASVPSNILWGNLSDTTGLRRPFVLIGFGGLALALFMMGVATSIPSYFFANLVLGLLATASVPIGTVLVLEVNKREDWANELGSFSKVGGIGWVGGLALGVLWLQLGDLGVNGEAPLRTLFILAATLSTLSILIALRFIPEPRRKVDRRTVDLKRLSYPLIIFERARYLPGRMVHVLSLSTRNMSSRNFPVNLRRYYLVAFFIFAGTLSFFVTLPIFLLNEMGLSSSEVFLVYLSSSAVSAITYQRFGGLVTAMGGKRVQMRGLVGRAVAFPAFILISMIPLGQWENLLAAAALHGLVGYCWAAISVSGFALVSNLSYSAYRAEGMGLYNSTQGIASIMGSLLGGVVAQFLGYLAAFCMASAFLVTAMLLLRGIDVDTPTPEDDSPIRSG